MKKSLIICVALFAILVFCLVGCTNKLGKKTVSTTNEIWNQAEQKESNDVIVISNFKFSNLIVVERVKITFDRKFEKGKTTIKFLVNELKVNISKNGKFLLTQVFNQLRDQLNNPQINYAEFEDILNNFQSVSGTIVLTGNNSHLQYNIAPQIEYKPEVYSQEISGAAIIDQSLGFGTAIEKAMQLLSSHLSTVFVPKTDGTAVFNAEPLNAIIKEAVYYQEKSDPDIKKKINKIFGVTHYSQVLNSKIVINESSSETVVKKDFIENMSLSFSKIQFMYNKEQLTNLLKEAVGLLDPDSASQVGAIGLLLTELTKGESCIEIDNITINSINKIIK